MVSLRKLIPLLAIACSTTMAHAAATATENVAPEEAAVRAKLAAVAGAREKALLHKELGDIYVARENFQSAAGEYIAALALDRSFPVKERIQMAVHIAWGDRLVESADELRKILVEHPDNLDARIPLARVLSWSGKTRESIETADSVLALVPGNKEALLIKANALRWQGDNRLALPIYRGLLEQEESFDARLGLAYVLLHSGDKAGSTESSRLLKPVYPYQEKERQKLLAELDRVMGHTITAGYSYYDDTDDNSVHRYNLSYSQRFSRWDGTLQYRHTDARDATRHNRGEELAARALYRVTDHLRLGAGAGFGQFGNGDTNQFVTWQATGDADFWKGTWGVSIAGDMMTDTAQIIENRIRTTTYRTYVSQRLTERLSLYGSYSFRDLTDSNSAHDLLVSPSYTVYAGNPLIRTGYRFRYLDFRRQSGGGYFDPNDFMSHQLYVSLNYEQNRFYVYLEPYGGFQTFRRNGESTEDLFGGITGTVGYRFSRHFATEINGEFGNYALGTATGFEYYQAGLNLIFSF